MICLWVLEASMVKSRGVWGSPSYYVPGVRGEACEALVRSEYRSIFCWRLRPRREWDYYDGCPPLRGVTLFGAFCRQHGSAKLYERCIDWAAIRAQGWGNVRVLVVVMIDVQVSFSARTCKSKAAILRRERRIHWDRGCGDRRDQFRRRVPFAVAESFVHCRQLDIQWG